VEPTIALVFSPELWVERLHHHLTDHGGARVRQIVLEPALALEDEYDTLVVSHRWPGLTRSFVDAIHQRARCVLGVFDPDEAAGREHLAALGADATIRSDAAVSEFIALLTTLTPVRFVEPRRSEIVAPALDRNGPAVITGPPGAGTSEIALGLAATVAARRASAVLVDADELASSTAARLGLAIEPNLRSAIDAVEHGLGDMTNALVRMGHPSFDVLCGLPSLAAATQIRPQGVREVLVALGRVRAHVLVEVSGAAGIEIARAVIADAGVLVGVGAANPVGVARLLGWAAALPPVGVPVHLVLNRAPTDRYQRAELTTEIYRTFTPASLTFVPTDRRVERAAWAGALVPRGPFTAGVAALAQAALPPDARSHRSERRARRMNRVSVSRVPRLSTTRSPVIEPRRPTRRAEGGMA
jgi:MinD-like ATPase involved in chromosome partitioning or flagellar assembly